MNGLRAVLKAIHSPACALSKNAQRVAVNIGWRMDQKTTTCAPLEALCLESHLGRSAVMAAITEVCGPNGLFTRTKRGPGKANLYSIKTAGFSAVRPKPEAVKTAGKPDVKTAGFSDAAAGVKTAGFPYAEQIDTSPTAIRRIQNIEERLRRVA